MIVSVKTYVVVLATPPGPTPSFPVPDLYSASPSDARPSIITYKREVEVENWAARAPSWEGHRPAFKLCLLYQYPVLVHQYSIATSSTSPWLR